MVPVFVQPENNPSMPIASSRTPAMLELVECPEAVGSFQHKECFLDVGFSVVSWCLSGYFIGPCLYGSECNALLLFPNHL